MTTKLQACKIGARAAANVARVQAFNSARPVRIAAAVVSLASKWGAALLPTAGGVDPAQVIADQVAQCERVRQAVQS